ncbi:MAG: prephenate dehydratase [Actinobacteria bacterium]|nr:prephenate dehydratase [Actinomycetota bacterium]
MSIKYAYLGPAGTFTEAALLKIAASDDQLIAYANVTAALDAVRKGEANKALVPIENSVEGVVARTLDELASGEPLVITAETTLPVTFSLMTLENKDPKDIKSIATHPHAESQCRSFIAKNYRNAQVIETASTAAAAKGLRKGDYDAAIGAAIAAKNYQLKIIAEDIGDNTNAVTRFVVVEKPGKSPAATGKDRTSLAVFIAIDHAGALLEVLNEFAKHQVNLSFIQSRPTGSQLGHYHFIIDAEGHIDDKPVAAALAGLKEICEDIRFLGSYPQAK